MCKRRCDKVVKLSYKLTCAAWIFMKTQFSRNFLSRSSRSSMKSVLQGTLKSALCCGGTSTRPSLKRPMESMDVDGDKSVAEQRLLVMGQCSDGQFGTVRGNNGFHCATEPTNWFLNVDLAKERVVQVCLGEKHSLALLESGRVFSCGANDVGQLGRESSAVIGPCEFKTGTHIVQIATGQGHNLAVASDGRLYAWGLNDNCQTGYPSNIYCVRKPMRVSELSSVCQIACGSLSSIALLESNKVFVFGWVIGQAVLPMEVDLLSAIPIRQVSAGGDHFAVLTSGGAVMCWGRNDYGQTSVERVTEVKEPTLVTGGVQNYKAIQVACGGRHTCVLTAEGHVYCFGANNFGQLGRGRKSALAAPSTVPDLIGEKVQAIACGSSHTTALTKKGLYSFGYNDFGQLGNGQKDINCYSPALIDVKDVTGLFAGWDQTVVLCGGDYRPWMQKLRLPKVLKYKAMAKLFDMGDKIDIIEYMEFVFNNLGCLNGSFLRYSEKPCSMTNHGVHMDDVMKTFNLIDESPQAKDYAEIVIGTLQNINFKNIYDKLFETRPDQTVIEILRFFLIMPWFHPMVNPSDEVLHTTLTPFVQLLEKATKRHGLVLRTWWLTLETRHFNRIVNCLINYVEYLFKKDYRNHQAFLPALSVLDMLCTVNKIAARIPYEKFYLNSLAEKVNIHQDYIDHFVSKHPERFPGSAVAAFRWSQYPFLMNAEAKAGILEADSMLRMHLSISRTLPVFQQYVDPEHAYLHYTIRRDHIVEDTYEQVMRTNPLDMAKPLRVNFVGEEGEDRGGVRKEFFLLLFQELLQPTYGMFVEDPDSHMAWFSGVDGDPVSYEVIGRLCALAIYNFTIVNLPFPLALYKKILSQSITLEDFKELHPVEGQSLEKLLEYEENDMEDVFCLAFTVNLHVFGHEEEVELIPGGRDVPVTQKNKQEFVQKYIEMKMERGLNDVISIQLNSFIRGFSGVLNNEILSLFQPRELMEMVIGNENYDWQEFKVNTEYKGEYHARHPAIECFWEVFFTLTTEEKKKFLQFLMGSDRIPLRGMKEIKMTIQPEPEELIPVAHTCFNLLDLPKLTDREVMRKRLLIALEHTKGFSLA